MFVFNHMSSLFFYRERISFYLPIMSNPDTNQYHKLYSYILSNYLKSCPIHNLAHPLLLPICHLHCNNFQGECNNHNGHFNLFFYRNQCNVHLYKERRWHMMGWLPSLTMHDTSMSPLMDNFLAPENILWRHLTFIDTAHFNTEQCRPPSI